jgi:uncharacterized protein YndB with AHSA1/START domain
MDWKKIAVGAAGAALVVFGAAYAYALTLPDKWEIEHSRVINAPAQALYDKVANFRSWATWTTWGPEQDPTVKNVYEGAESGQGARMSWKGEKLGVGRMEFIKADPGRSLDYHLWFNDEVTPGGGQFRFEPVANGTKVTWTGGGPMSGPAVMRLMVPMIESMVMKDFEAGLSNLAKLADAGEFKTPEPAPAAATPTEQAAPPAAGGTE